MNKMLRENRSWGCFAIDAVSATLADSEIPGVISTSSFNTASRSTATSSPSNGKNPARSSYAITANAYWSEAATGGRLRQISGAM